MDWTAFFDAAGLARQGEFVVWQPAAVTGVAALVASHPLEAWKDYLRFHVIHDFADVLPRAFAEQALPADDQLRQRLTRARSSLAAAIDLKRKATEALRPSILDNFGLFEAIRWEVKNESQRVRLPCRETYPDIEPVFTQDAAIGLFRIVQESLGVALRQPSVKAANIALAIDTDTDTLRIDVSHHGAASNQILASEDIFAICSIAHRVHTLGGGMSVTSITGGGGQYLATLPLARLTATPAVPGA